MVSCPAPSARTPQADSAMASAMIPSFTNMVSPHTWNGLDGQPEAGDGYDERTPNRNEAHGTGHDAVTSSSANPQEKRQTACEREADAGQGRGQSGAERNDQEDAEGDAVQRNRRQQHDKRGRAGNDAARDPEREQATASKSRVLMPIVAIAGMLVSVPGRSSP